LTGGDGSVKVVFVPGNAAVPGPTTFTVTATPTTAGQAPTVTTDPASGSPITVFGLVNAVSYTFHVTASSPAGSTPSPESDALNAGVPSSIAGTPPAGRAAFPYSYPFTIQGGPFPKLEVLDGALPPGLSLSNAGVLEGTPSQAGTYAFTIKATNGVGTAWWSGSIAIGKPYEKPSLDFISPSSGPVNGGTSATIVGTGFSGTTSVTFTTNFGKTTVQNFTVVDDQTIVLKTPPSTHGLITAIVSVENPAYSSDWSVVAYQYDAGPSAEMRPVH
jgi:hypothetical protein